jgi:hypothetical protein
MDGMSGASVEQALCPVFERFLGLQDLNTERARSRQREARNSGQFIVSFQWKDAQWYERDITTPRSK